MEGEKPIEQNENETSEDVITPEELRRIKSEEEIDVNTKPEEIRKVLKDLGILE